MLRVRFSVQRARRTGWLRKSRRFCNSVKSRSNRLRAWSTSASSLTVCAYENTALVTVSRAEQRARHERDFGAQQLVELLGTGRRPPEVPTRNGRVFDVDRRALLQDTVLRKRRNSPAAGSGMKYPSGSSTDSVTVTRCVCGSTRPATRAAFRARFERGSPLPVKLKFAHFPPAIAQTTGFALSSGQSWPEATVLHPLFCPGDSSMTITTRSTRERDSG